MAMTPPKDPRVAYDEYWQRLADTGDAAAQATVAKLRAQRADHAVRMRLIRIDHAIAMKAIDDRRRADEATRDSLATTHDGFAALSVKYRRGRPLDLKDAQRVVDAWREAPGGTLPADVARCRAHIETLARQHGITIEWGAHHQRGTAWPGLKRMRLPEGRTLWIVATWLHELAHNLHPCGKPHQRVETKDGSSLCVACEIRAWNVAIDLALTWTELMHRNLDRALGSYRRYATADEVADIDALSGPLGFRRALLRRALRDTKSTSDTQRNANP